MLLFIPNPVPYFLTLASDTFCPTWLYICYENSSLNRFRLQALYVQKYYNQNFKVRAFLHKLVWILFRNLMNGPSWLTAFCSHSLLGGNMLSYVPWSPSFRGFPGGASGSPPANAGNIRDIGSTHGLGRSPGGGHGNPLQYSCPENPLDMP